MRNNNLNFFSVVKELRYWLFLLLFGLLLFIGYKFSNSNETSSVITYESNLIQKQIKNVGKLVVTEGHFAEVLTYKDKKETYIPGLSFNKKAIVVVNAEVSVAFDLSKVVFDVDKKSKTLTIVSIPDEEIKINPDIKYYDITSSTFNEFTGEDYNKVNEIVRKNLQTKIANSSLQKNAKNRLISELTKFLIVTNSLGWTLKYDESTIANESDFSLLLQP